MSAFDLCRHDGPAVARLMEQLAGAYMEGHTDDPDVGHSSRPRSSPSSNSSSSRPRAASASRPCEGAC
jgi:hypothetical protein